MIKDKKNKLDYLKKFAEEQVSEYILPFWKKYSIDRENGCFYGSIKNDRTVIKNADKGLALNARILWAFSISYIKFGMKKDLGLVIRAYNYILSSFYDKEFGGYYWSLKYDGSPLIKKKQIYAQAFIIYSFSRYSI